MQYILDAFVIVSISNLPQHWSPNIVPDLLLEFAPLVSIVGDRYSHLTST